MATLRGEEIIARCFQREGVDTFFSRRTSIDDKRMERLLLIALHRSFGID